MRESSPGECKVRYFKECILHVAPSTNAEQKVLLMYRLTCSIVVLFKGSLFNCCCSPGEGQILVFISPFALWRGGEEEGERREGKGSER